MTHLHQKVQEIISEMERYPARQSILKILLEKTEELEFLMRTFEAAVPVLAASVMDLQAKVADLTAKLAAAEANVKSAGEAAAEAAVVTLTESLSPST